MRRDSWSDSCPVFPDRMSRISRLKLTARLCNLGLNPYAARLMERLMSSFSRPYVQTCQTQTLGATSQFGSGSGCVATRGETMTDTARLSRLKLGRAFLDQGGDGLTFATKAELAQLSRPRWRRHVFRNQGRDGATFQTKVETARPRMFYS